MWEETNEVCPVCGSLMLILTSVGRVIDGFFCLKCGFGFFKDESEESRRKRAEKYKIRHLAEAL